MGVPSLYYLIAPISILSGEKGREKPQEVVG